MPDLQAQNEFTLLRQTIEHLQEIHDDSKTPLDIATAIYPKIQELTNKERDLRGKAFNSASVDSEYKKAVEKLDAVNNITKEQAQDHANKLKTIADISNAVTAVLDLAIAVGKLAAA